MRALGPALVALCLSAAPARAVAPDPSCLGLLQAPPAGVSGRELTAHSKENITRNSEFAYIRKAAERLGLRAWLFGGSASTLAHYQLRDLVNIKEGKQSRGELFDYEFSDIFRSTQDIDIVIDGDPQQSLAFRNMLARRFPHFLGKKANKWEVRTLRHRIGAPGDPEFKEALLNDPDFSDQNTDSHSVGMIEITETPGEPLIRDIRHWDLDEGVFLDDVIHRRISYFRSHRHFTTPRAAAGENPEILSVIRLLVKAFQLELAIPEPVNRELKSIVDAFDPIEVTNLIARKRIRDTALKLVLQASNIEYAMNRLDELGLRRKLISMEDPGKASSSAWWLSREPLRSKPVGLGSGRTARELGIHLVTHETTDFQAYESLTRSLSGEPNALTSLSGDGFHALPATQGLARRGFTGFTVPIAVDPEAREGSDFIFAGEFVALNKKALRIVPPSVSLGFDRLTEAAESGEPLLSGKSDAAVLEQMKRRLNPSRISDESDRLLSSGSEIDHDRLVHVLAFLPSAEGGKLITSDGLAYVARRVFDRVSALENSSSDAELLLFVKTTGVLLKPIEAAELLKPGRFKERLEGLLKSPSRGFGLRKQAAFELLLLESDSWRNVDIKSRFPPDELKVLTDEIQGWHGSKDPRKRKFSIDLNSKLSYFIRRKDPAPIRAVVDSGTIGINHLNISGVSLLQLAAYYGKEGILEWLINEPAFDFNARNRLGYTELEQLRLAGRTALADRIERARPETVARRIEITERNPDGSPIVDFVRIEPGSFMMGGGREDRRALTNITRPFEVMSVSTTQELYAAIVAWLRELAPGRYDALNPNPSRFADVSRPVESVSYNDVSLWLQGLNELSALKDPRLQRALESLFPGHKPGTKYRRMTEAEWELTARLGGVAEASYSHGGSRAGLDDHVVYRRNSGAMTQPAGARKPVFYLGHPIYDIQGNVHTWIADWHSDSFGGTDPQGPPSGSYRSIRGGNWVLEAQYLRSGDRNGWVPSGRSPSVGFRIARDAE